MLHSCPILKYENDHEIYKAHHNQDLEFCEFKMVTTLITFEIIFDNFFIFHERSFFQNDFKRKNVYNCLIKLPRNQLAIITENALNCDYFSVFQQNLNKNL
jgi:hypothetical protein